MKKNGLFFVIMFFCSLATFAQSKENSAPNHYWEVGVSAGVTNFTGSFNIANGKNFEHFNNYRSDMNFGYGIFVRKHFTHVFALEGAYNGTRLSGDPAQGAPPILKPFQTGINELDLSTVWNMNNLFSGKKYDRKVYWYTKLGVGMTHINNIDYSNPTKMEPWSGWTIPIGTGVAFRLTEKVLFNIGTQWSWVNTNRLDGDNQGGTGTDYLIAQIREQYLYTHAGLSFRFGKEPVEPALVVVLTPPPAPTPKPEPKPELQPQPVQAPPTPPAIVKVTPPVVGNVYNILFGLNFGFDKSNLDNESSLALDLLVRDLLENPAVDVEIATHADSRGKAAYNMKLTERRGLSVKEYLTSNGIDASRIHVSAFGESKLTNNCTDGVPCSSAEHAANRRAEATIVVWKKN